MTNLPEPIEIGGIIVTPTINGWDLVDINYGMAVGILQMVSGPGWVLDVKALFMDKSIMESILKIIEYLENNNTYEGL